MFSRFLINVNKNMWSNSLHCLRGNEKYLSSPANYFPKKEEITNLTKRYFRQSFILASPKSKHKLNDSVIIEKPEDDKEKRQEPSFTDNKDTMKNEVTKAQEDIQAMSDQNINADPPNNILALQQNKEKIVADGQNFQHPTDVKLPNPSGMKKEKEKISSEIEEDKKEENKDDDLDPIIVTPKRVSKLMDRKEFIHNLNEIGAQKLKDSHGSPKYKFVFEIKKSKSSKNGQEIQVEIKASESLQKLQTDATNVDDIYMLQVKAPKNESKHPTEQVAIANMNSTEFITESPKMNTISQEINTESQKMNTESQKMNTEPQKMNAESQKVNTRFQEIKAESEYPNTNQRTIKPLYVATYNSIKHHENLIKLHYQQLQAQQRNLEHADELMKEHARLLRLGKKR